MNNESIKRLWAVMDAQRGSASVPTLETIFDLADEHSIALDSEVLWTIGAKFFRGEGLCPPAISSFVVELLGQRKIERLFNPWLSSGTLISPISRATGPNEVVGLHPRDAVTDVARRLLPEGVNTVLRSAHLGRQEVDGLGEFDVVVSVPPFNMRPMESFTINKVEFRDYASNAILGRALNALSDNGIGIFVVPPGFWLHSKGSSIRAGLTSLGLYVDAAFSFPVGVFSPLTSIPCDLLVLRRGQPAGPMFCGEVGLDSRRRKSLLSNYAKRQAAKDPRLGVLADFKGFRGVPALIAQFAFEKKVKRLGLPQRLLSDLTIEISPCPREREKVVEKPNTFFLPRIASSRTKTSMDQLPQKPTDYMQVVVDPEKAEALLVAAYLDGPLGKEARFTRASGATLQRVPRAGIGDLPVYLPQLDGQREVLRIDQKIDELTSELTVLREQLWRRMGKAADISKELDRINRDDTFKDWLETLPFPLASILWTYHTLQDQPVRRYHQLEFFLEGLAQFLAVLLLSGVRNDETLFTAERKNINSLLRRQHLSLERASFGTWVVIYERLAKTIRSQLATTSKDADQDIASLWKRRFAAPEGSLLADLCSKKITRILKEANTLRNDWRGHGGVVSDSEAKHREFRLRNFLTEFREIVGRKWEDYLLVVPGNCRFTQGEYRYGVSVAQGFAFPFPKQELRLTEPLEDGQLNLVNPQSGTSCPLAPLVRLGSAPEAEKNACYFFNRVEGEQLRFVSYHFESKAEIEEQFQNARGFIEGFIKS